MLTWIKTHQLYLLLGILFFLGVVLSLTTALIAPRKARNASPTPTPYLYKTRTLPSLIPSPQVARDISLQSRELGNLVLSYTPPSLPTSLRVYAVDRYLLTANEATAISQAFGFTTAPEATETPSGASLLWRHPTLPHQLTIYTGAGYIEYVDNSDPATTTARPSDDDLSKIAVQFAKDKHILFTDTYTTTVVAYEAHLGDTQPAENPEAANMFEVQIDLTLGHLKLYQQYGNPTRISVWFDKQKAVKKVSAHYLLIGNSEEKKLLPVTGIEGRLKAGSYTIARIGERAYTPREIKQLTKTTLTTIELVYFNDRVTGFVMPIYLLTGTAVSNSTEHAIIIYVPALE